MINQAISFATEAHKNQFRKGTRIPFIVHPMEVASIVARITDDKEVIAAAVLHDTVEDCKHVTIDMLRESFGERIADLVDAESENKADSWIKRKGDTIEALKREKEFDKKIIALADKLSNVRSLYHDYHQIGDALWDRFNMKDKEKQGWYYKGICEALEDLSELNEYREFKEYVNQIFN